jgi:peptidoglycan/LPS O-acetylase OafA/YrhL
MSHFWSLAVEEHFYLIWPTVFLLGTRVAFGFSGLFAIACLTVGPIVTGAMTGVDVWRWTFPAAAPIAFGCVAAIVVENPVAARLFLNEKVASSALLFSLVGLLSPAFLTTDTLWLVSISVLIVFVYYKQNSLFVNFLEFRPLAYLGLISYGLYVWQGVFTGNGSYRVGESFPPGLDLGVWLTFLVAPISYVFFEQPILKLKRQYSWRQHEG